MTDLNTMTKDAINALLAAPLTASQLKKVSKAELIAMFDAMPASDALDADLRDARADETPPTDPTLGNVLANLTDLQKRVVVALLDAGIDCNGAETLDAMRADNMTYADVAELSQRTGLTKSQVKGVLSGLSGIVDTDVEKPNGQAGVDQVLTDFGVIVAFELLADGVVANPGPAKAEKPAKTSNVVKLPTPKKEKAAPTPKKGRSVEDRVLVQPAKDLKDVKPMTAGSKRHLICEALLRGTTVEHLSEITGWKRDVVSSALYYDVKQVGLGVERKGGKLFLLMPEGVKKLPLRDKTTTRADALVAACR
jgi:hypothetical protein